MVEIDTASVMDDSTPAFLRVLRGAPTDEELAAVTAVLRAVAGHRAAEAAAPGARARCRASRRTPRWSTARPYRAAASWTSG
ncbi:acyl-CoA carboxylase subunit epsilon [Actinomadura fibrosa]|uniref:Acyl-CoA carboxylase subunit epsilon n=2 Tax=Actinomadura fibrosa TaxID=111802 RepID=A0ABW2XMW6_9ACTN